MEDRGGALLEVLLAARHWCSINRRHGGWYWYGCCFLIVAESRRAKMGILDGCRMTKPFPFEGPKRHA